MQSIFYIALISVIAAAIIDYSFYLYRRFEWEDERRKNPQPRHYPADDLIGKELRDGPLR